MTDYRAKPHLIRPQDDTGALVPDGNYVLSVVDGKVTGFSPAPSGGGTLVDDAAFATPAGSTRIDGFNDRSLAAMWTRVDASGKSGNIAWGEGNDTLSAKTGLGTDSVAELHGLVVPLSSFGGAMADGDGFVSDFYCSDFPNTNYVIGGVVLSDSAAHGSGNQLLMSNLNHPGTVERRIFTNWNTQASATNVFGLTPRFRRIAKISGTTWRVDVSADYVTWVAGTTFTWSATPTHVGFAASSWGTGTKGTLTAGFLDRVAGVT